MWTWRRAAGKLAAEHSHGKFVRAVTSDVDIRCKLHISFISDTTEWFYRKHGGSADEAEAGAAGRRGKQHEGGQGFFE